IRLISSEPVTAFVEVFLYGNPAYFTKFSSSEHGLEASGLATIRIMSSVAAIPNERSFGVLLEPPADEFRLLYEVGVGDQRFYGAHEFRKALFNTEMQW